MKRILFFSFPVILKIICGIAAVVLTIMAMKAAVPKHAAYYALMAVGMAAGCWLVPTMDPTMERPVSAQEVWDNAPVDKLLAHYKTLRAFDRL